MHKQVLFAAMLIMTASLNACWIVSAQETIAPIPIPIEATQVMGDLSLVEISKMSAAKFESWNQLQADKVNLALLEPTAKKEDLVELANFLSSAILHRLQEDKFTTDSSLRTTVDVWRMGLERTALGAKPAYPQTNKLIDSLIQNLQLRPEPAAWLYELKALIAKEEGDNVNSAEAYETAAELFNTLHINIDLRRVANAISRGDMYQRLGDKAKSEAAYHVALSYPFHLVSPTNTDKLFNSEIESQFRNLYLRAGRSVLELRRHNLKALKETRFWPMASLALGPTLKQYTLEAKREAAGDDTPIPAAQIPMPPPRAMPPGAFVPRPK